MKRSDSKISREKLLVTQMRGYVGLVKKNIKFLSLFIGYKWQWVKKEVVVELPHYGQLCVPIHKGYKIFDFDRRVVIKVFDQDVDSSGIREEVELLSRVSGFKFAPALKEWNVEERWYEEEYVQGVLDSSSTPMDSATVKQKFSDEMARPLIEIMLSQKLQGKNALNYVLDILRNVPMQAGMGKEVPMMASLVDSLVEQLKGERDGPIFLAFAHGDFVPANMLNTPQGMKIIDWEGAGYRSALFDFYSYFFYRPANRNVPVRAVMQEIQEALPRFIADVAKKDQDVARSVMSLEHIYRWTYYIEWICRLVDRSRTDKNLDMVYYMQRYLLAFHEYEEILASQEACYSRDLS